jgi:hypothetical protein
VFASAATRNRDVDSLFAAPVASAQAASTAYVLTRRGPALDPSEFDQPDTQTVEIMILWGDLVLHVDHLTPPRSYYVGEEERSQVRCDYFLPQDKVGASRVPVVLVDADGGVSVVIPEGATGSVELPGWGKRLLQNILALREAAPCAELAGAHKLSLPFGAKTVMTINDLTFRVASVPAARKCVAGPSGRDWATSLYVGLSMSIHAGLMTAMALFTPPMGLADADTITDDQTYLMQHYLAATAEPERQRLEDETTLADQPSEHGGGTGTRATGAEGSMGAPASSNANGTYGVKGSPENKDPHIANATEARKMAESFGMIGILNSGALGDPDAPTAPWGRDESFGNDPLSARGNMWGSALADAAGAGGLGLSGIGEGGNGPGQGVGLGYIGTIGRGAGAGIDQGFGNSHGRFGRGRMTKAPRVTPLGTTTVNGRIPAEVIQRIVRQNYGRFRVCYEQGLRSNPSLTGRVAARFVIGRDGSVSSVANSGSDLPDPNVTQCVTSTFYGLSFPEPDGGIVTVIYPILFTPGS